MGGSACVRVGSDGLSLDECIGQVMCFGWSGTDPSTPNDHAVELVDEMRVGGVILLGRNAERPETTRTTLAELQRRSAIPLLVAVDQEGGRVNRFGPPLTAFPGNMALGACGGPGEGFAYQQARCQALELRDIGVNWNLAPVLDVNSNPLNPVIGVRSYGEDPAIVARLGTAAIRGFRDGGVLACAKHFPGHGNTAVDTHLGLPTVASSRLELEALELVPFRAAIAEGVPAIMTTHIVFSAIDPSRPATLSRAVLTDLLREDLHYSGLVITDCLEMAAISDTIGTPAGAVGAIAAGADMVLVSHTLDIQREVIRAMRNAVWSGVISEARLREAAGRVLSAKSRLSAPVPDERSPSRQSDHAALELEIARSSITLIRNAGGIPIARSRRVAVTSFDDLADTVSARLNAAGVHARSFALKTEQSGSGWVETLSRLSGFDAVVVLTAFGPESDGVARSRATSVREVVRVLGDRVILVAARDPYDVSAIPEAGTAICTYGSRPCSIQALAEVLAGRWPAQGRLPVSLPPGLRDMELPPNQPGLD